MAHMIKLAVASVEAQLRLPDRLHFERQRTGRGIVVSFEPIAPVQREFTQVSDSRRLIG